MKLIHRHAYLLLLFTTAAFSSLFGAEGPPSSKLSVGFAAVDITPRLGTPMAGYYSDEGFFILVTYDILAKLGRWTNGEGFQLDLGYIEHLGSQVHLGGKISTRKIKYKSDRGNSLAVEKNVQDTFPSLVLTYIF